MKHILTSQIRPMFFFEEEGGGGGGGAKEAVHISKEAREFGKRFAPPADVMSRQPEPKKEAEKPPVTPPEKKEGDQQVDERAAERARENEASRQREDGRQPGFLKQQIEAKKAAEKERDDAKAAIDKYEKETVPQLNKQIADLQAKIDSGNFSATKEQEFQNKINEIEKARAERDQELSEVKKRLAAVSIVDDPVYKEKYLRPLGESIEGLKGIVGSNAVLAGALNRAMQAQKAALQATTSEERSQFEDERDQILSQMLEGMDPVKGRRLNSAFDRFLETSEAQAVAMADHERTALELRKEAEQRMKEGVQLAMQEWSREFDSQAANYEEDVKLPDNVQARIKELGITIDLDAENKFARGAIEGKLNKADVVKLIHRGRVHPVLRAQVKALNAIISDQQATIAKLRGAGPGPADRGGNNNPPPGKGPTNHEGKTRAEWESRFKPR